MVCDRFGIHTRLKWIIKVKTNGYDKILVAAMLYHDYKFDKEVALELAKDMEILDKVKNMSDLERKDLIKTTKYNIKVREAKANQSFNELMSISRRMKGMMDIVGKN